MRRLRLLRYRRFDPVAILGRLLVVVLVVAIVGAVAAKVWVNRQINGQLEQLQVDLREVGQLNWSGVYNSFNGDRGVSQLSFIPNRGSSLPPFSVEQVNVRSGPYQHLLRAALFGSHQWPDESTITFSGLSVHFVDLLGVTESATLSGNPFEALACADVDEFIRTDLEAMELYSSESEGSVEIARQGPSQLEITLTQSIGEFTVSRLGVELQVASLDTGPQWTEATLSNAWLSLAAKQFNNERNKYCATKTDLAQSDFVDANIAAMVRALGLRGWQLDSLTLNAYREFLQGAEPWRFEVVPETPILLGELVTPAGRAEQLAASRIQNTVGSRGLTKDSSLVAIEPLVEYTGPQIYVPEQSPSVVRRVNRWQSIEASALGSYVNRPVKIATPGSEYQGYLDAVIDGRAVIATRVPGGIAQIPIAVDQIVSVEVIP